MGNVLPWLALSTKGTRGVLQWHERWHYNTEVHDSLYKLVHGLSIDVDTLRKGIKVKTSDEIRL